ncbi:MAG TPA: cell division protein FtsA, partial [bacterium]|nr:cell division protein FtsA [bacterium]
DEKDVGVMLLDIGGGTTDIALYYKGALRFVKVVPVGGQHITNDIVTGLQTPKATAEDVKKKFGIIYSGDAQEAEAIEIPEMGSSRMMNVEGAKLTQIIKPRVHELIKFVEAELEKEGIERGMYAGGIILTGGTAMMKGLDRLIKEELDIRVRIGAPVKERVAGLYDIVNTPEYATVIGLIEHYLKDVGRGTRLIGKKSAFASFVDYIKKLISDNI